MIQYCKACGDPVKGNNKKKTTHPKFCNEIFETEAYVHKTCFRRELGLTLLHRNGTARKPKVRDMAVWLSRAKAIDKHNLEKNPRRSAVERAAKRKRQGPKLLRRIRAMQRYKG